MPTKRSAPGRAGSRRRTRGWHPRARCPHVVLGRRVRAVLTVCVEQESHDESDEEQGGGGQREGGQRPGGRGSAGVLGRDRLHAHSQDPPKPDPRDGRALKDSGRGERASGPGSSAPRSTRHLAPCARAGRSRFGVSTPVHGAGILTAVAVWARYRSGSRATLSIAEAVREEVQRALQPEVPVTTVAPEEPTLSYAAVARRPPQAPRQATAPPRRDAPTPQYPRRQEDQAHVRPDRPAPRKTDVWRTADRRPLCYHCGEADHVYRRCPYRRLGLRGFHPNDPRPRYGERPREIDEYLRRPQSPEPASRREFRSPSPRRAATPGGGVAEDDRRQEPPRTSERSHSNATGDRNDAPATVSNNLNVVIDGHDASALVDTGADYSVLSGRLSRRLRKVTTPWDGPQIRTAGGHLITPVGRCTARVEIHGETCPVKFVVLQDCSRDVILGMDFLCEYGAVIDLGANRLTLRKPVPPPEEPKATSSAVRVLASHVNLPPRSSVFVPVGIMKLSAAKFFSKEASSCSWEEE
ncbi:hypothetical protein ISCGN_025117 [Ixodes scapularis]